VERALFHHRGPAAADSGSPSDGRLLDSRLMEFLLECIGFAPGTDLGTLAERVRAEGEPVAWRGPEGEHMKLTLAPDVELRLDQDEGEELATLLPYYGERARLRIGVSDVRMMAESPFDALLTGWVAPPLPGVSEPWGPPGAYLLAAWLTDARRLPARMGHGHVLAISIAGFAVDVSYLGPNAESPRPEILENPRGSLIEPLGGAGDPGGCSEVSARISKVRLTQNTITGETIHILEIDAPERALRLFVSPWQLEHDGLAEPRPGYRIEGTFLFLGRITGGLPRPRTGSQQIFG
jgi:hypothetical protein